MMMFRSLHLSRLLAEKSIGTCHKRGYLADNFESYTKGVKATTHQKAATSVGQEHTPAQVKNKLDHLSNNMKK